MASRAPSAWPAAPERRLLLEGLGSCRDLGGYLTRTGAVVRWRAALRWEPAGTPGRSAAAALARFIDSPLTLLDTAALTLPETLEAAAWAETAVLLCSSGSTELVDDAAAVLLGVLGVADDDVARDYALGPGVDVLGMRRWLREVRAAHGSMTGYAADIGADVAVISALRDRLLH